MLNRVESIDCSSLGQIIVPTQAFGRKSYFEGFTCQNAALVWNIAHGCDISNEHVAEGEKYKEFDRLGPKFLNRNWFLLLSI